MKDVIACEKLRGAIFAAGLTLFVLTLVFNLLGFWLRRRFREEY